LYSGFVTSRRAVSLIGIHQKFDTAAYRMIEDYLAPGTFPALKQIIHFEGVNGPDGLKVKSPGEREPGHLYNPLKDEGPIPELIKGHYIRMVSAIKCSDTVRAAFEAAWMAHYICDGLTPAHHYPLEVQIAEHSTVLENEKTSFFKHKVVDPKRDSPMQMLRKGWAIWGGKGLLSTHFNFEMGVATALLGSRVMAKLDPAKLAEARKLGPILFFKQEALDIANLELYETFYEYGWNTQMARMVKQRLAPQTAHTIGVIWLLAYLEAGLDTAKEVNVPATKKNSATKSSTKTA
jgi:hypothetical protein